MCVSRNNNVLSIPFIGFPTTATMQVEAPAVPFNSIYWIRGWNAYSGLIGFENSYFQFHLLDSEVLMRLRTNNVWRVVLSIPFIGFLGRWCIVWEEHVCVDLSIPFIGFQVVS